MRTRSITWRRSRSFNLAQALNDPEFVPSQVTISIGTAQTANADEAGQEQLDLHCHHYGVGQLVFGLFAAICIEMIKVPNTVIYTGETDDWLVAGGMVFVLLGAFLLVRHAFALLFLLGKKVNAPLV